MMFGGIGVCKAGFLTVSFVCFEGLFLGDMKKIRETAIRTKKKMRDDGAKKSNLDIRGATPAGTSSH